MPATNTPAATTTAAYEERVKRLKASVKAEITDTAKYVDAVNAMNIKPGTKKNYFIALHNHAKGTPAAEVYKAQFIKHDEDQKKLPPPQAPDLTYEQIRKAGERIMNDDKIALETRILAGLCTQLNPVRLDYCELALFHGDHIPADYTANYIQLKGPNNSQLVVQEHKTTRLMAKVFGNGSLCRTLTPALFALIIVWEADHPDERLLAMSSNNLGKAITRMFERYANIHVTQNTIRHAYVTSARDGDRPLAVVSKIAREMGHSVATNEMYRWDNFSPRAGTV